MSASLVGSEMCIRDRDLMQRSGYHIIMLQDGIAERIQPHTWRKDQWSTCLLYTSDAADDM
eukprot:1784772-Alexandrium_andersonii.AAC.1